MAKCKEVAATATQRESVRNEIHKRGAVTQEAARSQVAVEQYPSFFLSNLPMTLLFS